MRKRLPYFFFLFCLLLPEWGSAQGDPNTVDSAGVVIGRVLDEDDGPMPFVPVRFFKGTTGGDPELKALPDLNDTLEIEGQVYVFQFYKGGLTDSAGRFRVTLGEGLFYPQVVGSTAPVSRKQVFELGPYQGLDMGILRFSKTYELDDVEIQAEQSFMKFELDKRVFIVGKDLGATGLNGAEILDNIPSVAVDVEGNVSLRGSQNVRILVDGKPSGLVGLDNADGLRQLQGSLIEKVEVITNPSSRYEAEGEVGIINIVLKKKRKKGLNGSFDLVAGWPHNHQAAYNLNLRRKKFNLFSSFGIGYRNSPGGGSSYQLFTNADTAFAYERERDQRRGGVRQNFRFGSDIFLSERHTLTVSGLYRGGIGDNVANLRYLDYNEAGVLTQQVTRDDEEVESKRYLEGALNYLITFPQKDRKWTFDFKYMESDDTENSDILEVSDQGGVLPLAQEVSNTEDEQTFLFQTDYIHPFGEKGRFEAGLRSSLRRIENDYGVLQQAEDNSWFPVPGFNNYFEYDENIHAAYVMVGNQRGKFSWQGGLRAEYSQIYTLLRETGEENPRDYLNFFPSAHLTYEFKPGSSLQLSYSRRISRPRFRNLLPFSSYSDNRNFRAGNPDLDPEYTNSLETGYLKYFKQGSMLSSVYYRYRTGVIQRIALADTTGFAIRIPVNLAEQHAFGLEFNLSYDPVKWWKLNANFNFYRAITTGTYEGESLDADAITWNGRVTSKIRFWKDADWQMVLDYRAPQVTPQGRTKAIYFMNLGLSKEILKKKGTISLNVRDVFNSRKWRWVVDGEGYYLDSEFQWRARQVQVGLNYRLGQVKKKGGKRGERGGNGGGGF